MGEPATPIREIAQIDQAGAFAAAGRIAVVRGPAWQRARQRERARHEHRRGVQAIELVDDREAAQRHVADVGELQSIAHDVAGMRSRAAQHSLRERERRHGDQHACGIFVASDRRIRLAVDVGIVAEHRGRCVDQQLRLVRGDRACGNASRDPDLELDQQLRARRHVQIGDVDDAGSLRAAGRIAVVHCTRGQRADQLQRPWHEHSLRVQRIDLVTNRETVERIGSGLHAQCVAQRVARRRHSGRVLAAAQIHHRLFEEDARELHSQRVRVLVVERADRAVGQRASVGLAIGIGAGIVRPLRDACDVGQCDAVVACRHRAWCDT